MEPQEWSQGRTFPGACFIEGESEALHTAQNWDESGHDTIWTDGSKLGSGRTGAACAWQTVREGWTGRRFYLGDNKEVFDTEVFAILQALRVFNERGQSGKEYTIFSDCQPAIQRARSDQLGPGQCWARAIIEVASGLVARGNSIDIRWTPAHRGVRGNEVADSMAKEAAGGQTRDVPDQIRWQASLPHLSRRATERRSETTAQWIRDHVRPESRYVSLGGLGFRKRAIRMVQKSTAQRYYQLMSGHAAIGSFLHDRMTGPQRLESDGCWWCNCGRRQSRHHLFTECRAWAPQIRELWRRFRKDCSWERRRAPALRWLWKDDAVVAVVEFLESARVGYRASAEMARARVDEDRGEEDAWVSEGEEGRLGLP